MRIRITIDINEELKHRLEGLAYMDDARLRFRAREAFKKLLNSIGLFGPDTYKSGSYVYRIRDAEEQEIKDVIHSLESLVEYIEHRDDSINEGL